MSVTDRHVTTPRSRPATLPPRGYHHAFASGRHAQRSAPRSEAAPPGEGVGIQDASHDHVSRMAQHPSGHRHPCPPHRRDRLGCPRGRTGEALKADDYMIGQHPDPEAHRLSPGLATGPRLQPHPVLKCLGDVLRVAALMVPAQHLVGRLFFLPPWLATPCDASGPVASSHRSPGGRASRVMLSRHAAGVACIVGPASATCSPPPCSGSCQAAGGRPALTALTATS